MNIKKWITSVSGAIKSGSKGNPVFFDPQLEGLSGKKILSSLQSLASLVDPINSIYLEIGVYRGLTLTSVAAATKKLQCVGIDNFSQFDLDQVNKNIVTTHIQRLKLKNCTLIDEDYVSALLSFKKRFPTKKIGLLFVDGPHDYRSQLLMIQLAIPHLADNAIIVIDDCNYEHVRLATADLLRINPELNLLFEAYTPNHPNNDLGKTGKVKSKFTSGWWNGLHVLVYNKGYSQNKFSIETGKEVTRCLDDHIIHSHFYADHLLTILDKCYALSHAKISLKTIESMYNFFKELKYLKNTNNSNHYSNVRSKQIQGEYFHDLTSFIDL